MITPAERITFILTRGAVALALVGAGIFCIYWGVSFWALPREEASNLGVDLLGLHINAGGLGGVIFGTGIAICFLAYKTAPRRLEETGRESSNLDQPPAVVAQAPTTAPPASKQGPSGGGGGGGGGGGSRHREWSNRVYRVDPRKY